MSARSHRHRERESASSVDLPLTRLRIATPRLQRASTLMQGVSSAMKWATCPAAAQITPKAYTLMVCVLAFLGLTPSVEINPGLFVIQFCLGE